MSREILFRGKTKEGYWAIGAYAIMSSGIYDFARKRMYKTIPDTIGQYIGLKDKNGNKIFEGDILKFWQVETFINKGIVDYKDCWFGLTPIGKSLSQLIDIAIKWHNAEVIGNIFDNPELLEVKNDYESSND